MNKLLVSGLSLGSTPDECGEEEGPDTYTPMCNYDYSWLLHYPSSIIWADKIIISNHIWKTIQAASYPKPSKLAACIKHLFGLLQSEGVVVVEEPSKILTAKVTAQIDNQIKTDTKILLETFANRIRKCKNFSHGVVNIENQDYCFPHIRSIYSGMVLARAWDANCTFDSRSLNYLKYKFGAVVPREAKTTLPKTFQEICSINLPNDPLFPNYSCVLDKKCKQCVHQQKCDATLIRDTEKSVYKYLAYKNRDEVQQVKSFISRITKDLRKQTGDYSEEDVLYAFQEKTRRYQKLLTGVFPKIKRWANLGTIASIPVAVYGLASSNSFLTIAAAAIAGSSESTKEIVKLFENKYRWVGFSQKDIVLGKK